MTVLRREATRDVAGNKIGVGTYLGFGLLSLALGAGAVWAAFQVTETPAVSTPTPVEIAQLRADGYVNYLGAQWLARVHNARAEAMVDYYSNAYKAQLAGIHSQRAQEMVQHFANSYQLSPAQIGELRAQEMVQHFANSYRPTVEEIYERRAADMVEFRLGSNS